METNPTNNQRRSVRLKGYDYRAAGMYFVTMCAVQKRPIFGQIEDGAVRLRSYGKIVVEEWERTAILRPSISLDEYIVMPDHFHAIVVLNVCRGMACHAQNPAPGEHQLLQENVTNQGMARHAPTFGAPQAQSLSTIIGAFKSAVTRRINAHRAERGLAPVIVWQRNFYERIIRDEKEWHETQRYTFENPLRSQPHTKP